MSLSPTSSRGGALPNPITTPVSVALAADAVALRVEAASGGAANLVELVPDNAALTQSLTSFGRWISNAFQYTVDAVGNAFGVWAVEGSQMNFGNDDSGDFILEMRAAAADKIGFFNVAPVVRPHVTAAAPTVQNVIDALVLLGLVEQS